MGSRVIARLKEFMSDTSHRGKVVFLMMTNRPDKLDTDLKRPGRFDLKIPFFFPETQVERLAILNALIRKNKLRLGRGVKLDETADNTAGYSGAELEAVLLAAAGLAIEDDREQLRSADLRGETRDVRTLRWSLQLLRLSSRAAAVRSGAQREGLRFAAHGSEGHRQKEERAMVAGGRGSSEEDAPRA